jgi:hypothetical protein
MIARGIRRFSIGGSGVWLGSSIGEERVLEAGSSITTIIIDGEAAASLAHTTGLVARRRGFIDGVALITGVPAIASWLARVLNEAEFFKNSDKGTSTADPFVRPVGNRLGHANCLPASMSSA